MNKTTAALGLLSLSVLALAACGKSQVSNVPIPADQAAVLIGKLAVSLKGELISAIAAEGPASAIDVCAKSAPEMSAALSSGEFSIRRVGTRVRNDKNAPTPAELTILEGLTMDAPTFQGEVDGHPVFMKALFIPGKLCITCHGTPEQIPAEVKTVLAELYPGDKATGYAIGDLRGALIVERN